VIRIKENAVAASAPAMTGVHCKYLGAACGPVTVSKVMFEDSAQAEKGQHSQNDHD
jgi:hypothetical protein